MRHEPIHRLAALVSYGTRFLRNDNVLEDWYRHSVFHEARCMFRTEADNVLVADDFTLWLIVLKGAGVVRLSLHPAAEFALVCPDDERRCAFAVVAHHADSYQVWMVGEEPATWRDAPAFTDGGDYWHYLQAKSHGGAIDSYWAGAPIPGTLQVQPTDWHALAATIGADLDIALPADREPAVPFVLAEADDAGGTALPLLPASDALPAHRLAAALAQVQAKFANDTHPRNEGNIFLGLNAEGEARVQNWGRRLDNWMIDVLMRGANDGAGSRTTRAIAPPPVPAEAQDSAAAAPPQQASHKRATLGSWGARIGLAIVTAVCSVFFAAAAQVVAAYPWLAILLGLAVALHLHYKTRDNQA